MSAATFLAPSLDGGAKPGTPTGASKGGAGGTDLIRALLREQQKNCQVLHANPLFKEFRSIGQQKKAFGKGYQVVEESTPNFGDVDAEGQARLFELIKVSSESFCWRKGFALRFGGCSL